MEPEAPLDWVGKRIGNYLVREKLRDAPRARLYLAEHEQLNRQMAVHVPRDLDPAALVRFAAAADQASRVRSPHVAAVLDVGELEGTPYFTSEWVRGQSLAELLGEDARLPMERVVVLARGIAHALHAAHAAGWIHGDLRPEEIVLAPEGEARADFVKLRGLGSTHAVSGLGFPYWSPERMLDEPLTRASDVYALGAIVYRLLTGRTPLDATDERALLKAHLTQTPPPPTAVVPELPPHVDAVLARALHRCAALREQDALAFADALAAPLASVATPPPEDEEIEALPRRRRPIAFAAGFVAVPLLAFLVFSRPTRGSVQPAPALAVTPAVAIAQPAPPPPPAPEPPRGTDADDAPPPRPTPRKPAVDRMSPVPRGASRKARVAPPLLTDYPQ